jgi:hypothetical protein
VRFVALLELLGLQLQLAGWLAGWLVRQQRKQRRHHIGYDRLARRQLGTSKPKQSCHKLPQTADKARQSLVFFVLQSPLGLSIRIPICFIARLAARPVGLLHRTYAFHHHSLAKWRLRPKGRLSCPTSRPVIMASSSALAPWPPLSLMRYAAIEHSRCHA